MDQAKVLGDLIERAGEKVKGAGFQKIGDVIYALGDKIEHLQGLRKTDKTDGKNDKSKSGAV